MGKKLLIFILILISILSYYSYGSYLGSDSVVLNQTCAQFCLYNDPFDDPGDTRDSNECNGVSSQSQCSHGKTNTGLDLCNIAYGKLPSNTYSVFGYPL